MRPIYLKMSAFGSYANETEIDFTNVEQGVFLITGDTGSGKTTIFDAITFALYGQTSGGKREGTMMRSQYADLSTRTFVELLFECRGERYRVIRNPEYERESKRKKKDGQRAVTKEKASVELYLPDGSLYPGNRQEINGKLVEILGVDARQFTQISMIAQGEFLKLLHARSDERKEIFSRIFDTRIFRSVQEELKNRTKQLYGQLEDNRKACLREIQQLEAEEECLPGIRQLLDQLLDSSAKEPDLDLEEIIGVQILEADRTEYELLQEQDKNVRKELDTQNRVYSISREYAERFRELDRIRDEIKKLEDEVNKKEKGIEAYKRDAKEKYQARLNELKQEETYASLDAAKANILEDVKKEMQAEVAAEIQDEKQQLEYIDQMIARINEIELAENHQGGKA